MTDSERRDETPSAGSWVLVAAAWTAVAIPLLWGVFQTLKKASQLFR